MGLCHQGPSRTESSHWVICTIKKEVSKEVYSFLNDCWIAQAGKPLKATKMRSSPS